MWAALSIIVAWLALLAGSCCGPGISAWTWLTVFSAALQTPLSIRWTEYTPNALLIAAVVYGFAIALYYSSKGNRRPGEEHGSAKWGNPRELLNKYRDKRHPKANLILTKHVRMGMDGRKHRRNLNIMVVGGSGAGKTRFYVKPNLMQASCSYLCADPKGETLRALGPMFETMGIPITVLNLVDMSQSDCYNPFAYLRTDTDVIRLVNNLIKNTTPKGATSNDPFWDSATRSLTVRSQRTSGGTPSLG